MTPHLLLRSWMATRLRVGIVAAMSWVSAASAAQPAAPDVLAERGAELKSQRDALESRHQQTLRECYQQFNVTDCRHQARERYIAEHHALREQELLQRQQERQARSAVVQDRLHSKQLSASDRTRDATRASEAAQVRQQEMQRKQNDHDASAQPPQQRQERAQDARAHRADVERRARERDKPRAAPLPSPVGTP